MTQETDWESYQDEAEQAVAAARPGRDRGGARRAASGARARCALALREVRDRETRHAA